MEEPKINKAFAYRIHLMRMGQAKQPTVSYQAFCERLKKWWGVNKAIYTPADLKKVPPKSGNMVVMKPKKSRWRNLLDFFKKC